MNQNNSFENPIVWQPKRGADVRTTRFGKYIAQKYKTKIENYWDLHKWSIENADLFWKEIWDYIAVIHSKPYEKILDKTAQLSDCPKWFIGAELNYAENILRYRDNHTAIIVDGEDRSESEYITHLELYRNTCRYWAALKQHGLKKNDVVACYMSNRAEAIYAFLATAAIGAIWSGTLPLFGAQPVIKRLLQVKPKFLFTVDRFSYNNKEEDLLLNLKEISNELTTLEKIIVVPSKPSSLEKDISFIQNSCFLEDFLKKGEDKGGNIPDIIFEQLPLDHPIYISYTSGTTGNPKGMVHGFGTFLGCVRTFWLQFNGSRDDVVLSVSPTGWASWHIFCDMLGFGQALYLYEGVPFFQRSTPFWDLVDKYNLSVLLITPNVLDEFEKRNLVPDKNKLKSLKLIFSGGSVVKMKNFDFMYRNLRSDVPFCSTYGGTEFPTGLGTSDFILPIHKGEVSAPSLGTNFACLNDNGIPVEGEIGEVAFLFPAPAMPVCIWSDPDRQLYRKTNFSKFPNAFTPGDLCIINPKTKGIIIIGRSDDTLNPGGCRFGCSDIYDIVCNFDEVKDSLIVSQYMPNGAERAALFVQMRDGANFTERLKKRIEKIIASELSARHVPAIILETKDIPYNLNGKKMEIIVKKIINKMPYNADTVINKESLALYQNIPELENFSK